MVCKEIFLVTKIKSCTDGENKVIPHFVCPNALLKCFKVSYNKFKTFEQFILSGANIGPDHFLVGKKCNIAIEGIEGIAVQKFHDYFFDIEENKNKPLAKSNN